MRCDSHGDFPRTTSTSVSICFHSMKLNSIQFSSIQFNSIQFNSVQFSSVQFSSVQFSSIQFNSIQFNHIYSTLLKVVTIIYSRYSCQYVYCAPSFGVCMNKLKLGSASLSNSSYFSPCGGSSWVQTSACLGMFFLFIHLSVQNYVC